MLTTSILTINDQRNKPKSKNIHNRLPTFNSLLNHSQPIRPQTATTTTPNLTLIDSNQNTKTLFSPTTQSIRLRRASSTPILLQRVKSSHYYSKRKTRPELNYLIEPPIHLISSSSSSQDSNLIKKVKRKNIMMVETHQTSPIRVPIHSPNFQVPKLHTNSLSPEIGPSTPLATARLKSNEEHHEIETLNKLIKIPQDQIERRKRKGMDLMNFPQTELIIKLSNLLQQIATTNDQIDEPTSGRGATVTTEWSHDHTISRRSSKASSDNLSSPGSTWSSSTSRRILKARPEQSPTVAHFQQVSYTTPIEIEETETEEINKTTSNHNTFSTASKNALLNPSALLTFHAKHVPQISIESYLKRIQKYCPMTNEIFISILIYLDRMSLIRGPNGEQFVIDSWNVHRFLIATVTATSKFFSDVFYTNSRYAKVGGLPLKELDSLELQFLLLNDFRLMISIDELLIYATKLLDNDFVDDSISRPISCCSWSEESSEATITPGSPISTT